MLWFLGLVMESRRKTFNLSSIIGITVMLVMSSHALTAIGQGVGQAAPRLKPSPASQRIRASERIRNSLNQKTGGQFIYTRQNSATQPGASQRLISDLKRREENRVKNRKKIDSNDHADLTPNPPSSLTKPVVQPPLPQPDQSTLQPEVTPQSVEVPASSTATFSTLAEFEQAAVGNHPTLNSAAARVRAAQAEGVQAGLSPNPQLGLFIDELGNENDPGLWGAYIQRNVVRGNKLGLAREIKNREASVLELEFEKQFLRIKTDVRTAFYQLLIAQQKYELAYQLYESQKKAIEKSKQLFEAGESPRTDVIQTELQAQKTLVLLRQSEVVLQNLWRELAVAIGQPELGYQVITGQLDPITQPISYEFCLSEIMNKSPELLQAQAKIEQARATVNREVAETVPNYQTQFRLGRDSATNHFFTGVQLQVPIQVNDRNQGNIAAANTRVLEAQNNAETIKLRLAKRLASEFRQYESALQKSNLYASQLLPKSQEALKLLTRGYPEEVGILQVLSAQQQVIDITTEFLDSLSQVWASRVRIEGFLLDDSLNQ